MSVARSLLESHSSRTPASTSPSPFKTVSTEWDTGGVPGLGTSPPQAGVDRAEEDWRCAVPRDAGTAVVPLSPSRWVLAPASHTPRHGLHHPGCCSSAVYSGRMMAKPPWCPTSVGLGDKHR